MSDPFSVASISLQMLIVFFFCLPKFSRKKRRRRKLEKDLDAKSRASVNNI